MATNSRVLAWENSMDRGAWRATVHGSHKELDTAARRSNQSILKEIGPRCSLEGLMLKLKLQYFGHLMQRVDSLEKPLCWEGLGAGAEGDDRG